MLESIGEMAPRTQKATLPFAVVGLRRGRTATGRPRNRDGMANGDLLLTDQYLLDEKPDQALLFDGIQSLCGGAKPRILERENNLAGRPQAAM